jgi:hypothetical protein
MLVPRCRPGWRPGRVYFLTLLEPSRDDRTLALTRQVGQPAATVGRQGPASDSFTASATASAFSEWIQAAGATLTSKVTVSASAS